MHIWTRIICIHTYTQMYIHIYICILIYTYIYLGKNTDRHGYHETKKSSRDFSARDMSGRDMSMTNTFDTNNFSKNNEHETKNFYGENNTGDEPVLFTDPVYSNSGKLHTAKYIVFHTCTYVHLCYLCMY
jgi:hypothetical protein